MRLRSGAIAANLWFLFEYAGIAQLVEQLICNQQVVGSSPTAGLLGTPSTSASADNAVMEAVGTVERALPGPW